MFYDHPKPKLFNSEKIDSENYAFESNLHSFYEVPSLLDVTLAPQDAINSFEFPIQQSSLSFADDTQAVVLEEDEEEGRPVRPVFQPLPINLNLDEETTYPSGKYE